MAQKLLIRDLTLRDGQQSSFATRMTQKQVDRVLPFYKDANFYAMEVWGGAVPDSVMRYLNENPWDRLEKIKAAVGNASKLTALSRGRNLFGYAPYTDEIIEGLKAELDKAKNDVARAYADTENMKKRLQKDADATRKYRFQQPATEILPILDSMEMALKVQTEDEAIKNYVKGFEMIHKQLKGVLEKEGVQEIDVADKPFDHNTMQALMQEKKEGVESGMVIEVLQKGYMLKDRILRPALVKVSE